MSSYWLNTKGASSDAASVNTNQPPGSFTGASFNGTQPPTSQDSTVFPQGENPEDCGRRESVHAQGHKLSYSDSRPQFDSMSTWNTKYTGSQLAASNTGTAWTNQQSLGRSDTQASRDTQPTTAPSLSALSQSAKPRDGEVWNLKINAPVLPNYKGIPVEPGTTNYKPDPDEVDGKTWHKKWKLQTLDDTEKNFVDQWSELTEQCGCGFGMHLPVQRNICKIHSEVHDRNVRHGLRILKQQYFNNSDYVTVFAWDKVLDTCNTFVSRKALNPTEQEEEAILWKAPAALFDSSEMSAFSLAGIRNKRENSKRIEANRTLEKRQREILGKLNSPS